MRSANEGETKSKIDSKDQVFEIKKKEQKKNMQNWERWLKYMR